MGGRSRARRSITSLVFSATSIESTHGRSRLASPAVPGASSLFVTLTASHPVRGHPLEHALDTRLFVPLSRDQRFAESPHP